MSINLSHSAPVMILLSSLVACSDRGSGTGITLGRIATLELSVGQLTFRSGDTIAISSGSLLPGEQESRATIKIVNTGQGDLAISEILVDSVPAETFRLVDSAASLTPIGAGPYTIVPQDALSGQSSLVAQILVTRPGRDSTPTGTLTIRSNSVVDGASQPETTYKLRLDVTPPKLVLVPDVVDVGTVAVGANRDATFTLDNRGGDLLVVDRTRFVGHPGFAVALGPHSLSSELEAAESSLSPVFEIPPGRQATARVRYTATGPENAAAQLTMFSNDPSASGGSRLSIVANAGAPTSPVVEIDAPDGASGPITCKLITEASDNEPLAYTWYWQVVGQDPFSTFGPVLASNTVNDCDLLTCWTEVSDGTISLSSNVAEELLPFGAGCDDQNPCTDDACGLLGGCEALSNTVPCDDADLCNGEERCADGQCGAGHAISCNEITSSCMQRTCNPVSGKCDLPVADNTLCADADRCNGIERCAAGVCLAGEVVDCTGVTNPCLAAECNPQTGICDLAKPDQSSCEDGALCNGKEFCLDGICQPGTVVECSGVTAACLERACNPLSGACDLPKPNGTSCADNSLCNGSETCQSGVCAAGIPVECFGFAIGCGGCNPETGLCDASTSDGASCDDGDDCTSDDTCSAGNCSGESDCDECGDGNLGESEACDDGNSNNDDACSNLCTANDAPCTHGVFQGVHFIVCADSLNNGAARQACRDLGYDELASVHSGQENAFVFDLALATGGSQPRFWIGLTDSAVEGTFVWYDSMPLDFQLWDQGHPTPMNAEEDCVHTTAHKSNPDTSDNKWNDITCADPDVGYACELRP